MTCRSATAATDFIGAGRIAMRSWACRTSRRVELGQRAVGRWLLPGGRRQCCTFTSAAAQGEPGTNRPGVCTTGLATLRRDGFASLNRRSRDPATGQGALVAGKRDDRPNAIFGLCTCSSTRMSRARSRWRCWMQAGRVLPGYGAERCVAIPVTARACRWRGTGADTERARGRNGAIPFPVSIAAACIRSGSAPRRPVRAAAMSAPAGQDSATRSIALEQDHPR